MSLESDGPAFESSPSDESWAQLYDRTRRDAGTSTDEGGREKRSRSPDFIQEKRQKRDALRAAFVQNKETIKLRHACQLVATTVKPSIEGLEAAFTAWVASQCERPLGHELTADDILGSPHEVALAKKRELDAWCKFRVFSPV